MKAGKTKIASATSKPTSRNAKLALKATGAARGKVCRASRLKLTIAVTFTATGGATASASKTTTLRR